MSAEPTQQVAAWLQANLGWDAVEFVSALSGATPISLGDSAMAIERVLCGPAGE